MPPHDFLMPSSFRGCVSVPYSLCERANNATVMAVSLSGLVQGGLYGNGDVFVHLWVCVCQ